MTNAELKIENAELRAQLYSKNAMLKYTKKQYESVQEDQEERKFEAKVNERISELLVNSLLKASTTMQMAYNGDWDQND